MSQRPEGPDAADAEPGRRAPPLVHLALAGAALVILLIGGTITFGSWGTLDVRLAMLYVLAAVGLHVASRYAPRGGLALRVGAYLTLVAMTVHTQVLLRPEVLVPLLALGGLDVALHRSELTREIIRAGRLAKVLAGLSTLVMIVLVGTLVVLAADGLILARTIATVVVAWGLVTVFALRPHLRTASNLLAGAAVFAVTFLLLTAPVIPFGPLIAYWTLVVAVALAVVTSTVTHTGPGTHPNKVRHAQRVHPMPDPVIAPVREEVRRYLATGEGAGRLSRRVEAALGRDERGRLVAALAEAQAKGTVPSRNDRIRALAELLELDPTRYQRTEENA